MKYSIEPRDRMYVRGSAFLSFAKNMGRNLRCNKTASKRAIQKTAEGTGDLIGNKIADKMTSVSKFLKKLHSSELHLKTDEHEADIPKERYISPEKRWQIIDELRLV